MKKTLLLLTALSFTTLHAQESTALMESMTTYVEDVCQYKNCYEYDAQGNKTSDIRYDWTSGLWQAARKTEYIHNDAGQLIADNQYRWEPPSWTIFYKSEYYYDTEGRVTSAEAHTWNDGQWVDTIVDYAYTPDGSACTQTSYYYMVGIKIPYSQIEKTYDEAGNEVTSILYLETGGWTPFSKWEMTYDGEGNHLIDLGYNWGDGGWLSTEKYEFSYDDEGCHTATTTYNIDADDWQEAQRWEFIYDADGNLIEKDYLLHNGLSWYKYGHYAYTYYDASAIHTVPNSPATLAPRKILKDGQIIITDGHRTHTLSGIQLR